MSPAGKAAAVNPGVASQNSLSQSFLYRCFEVWSTEVRVSLMSSVQTLKPYGFAGHDAMRRIATVAET